ncbi:uncharacterized protein IUM83_01962 [Phytophthora cinnamomi]|uniref:uncharacterized protein n=1 Tax=Phytophthora cinnamomi TaxID=4785 RepID=UPI00355AC6A1|nr:hypothetical protein IUM83_01962 [Phytophthora cinnamomi]
MARGSSSTAQLEQRWGFLSPWLALLDRRISYTQAAHEEEVWAAERRVLEVTLPAKNSTKYERYTQGEFNYELREVREALALVAAVGHIDQEAWKFLLNKVWGVKLGKKGAEGFDQDIPPSFVLIFDHLVGLVPGETELSAGSKLLPRDKPGLDIKIPVHVSFRDESYMSGRQFNLIANSEKIVKDKWELYGSQPVPGGKVRCTFELAPMVVESTDTMGYSSFAPKMEKMVHDNVWFSQVTLSAESGGGLIGDVRQGRDEFRQLMTAVFDSTRRSPARSTSRYYFDRGAYLRDGSPLQVNQVDLKTYTSLQSTDLGAIMSALTINQTAKKVTIRGEKRTISGDGNWMWLAYGLFSKRARAFSALETVALNQVDSLSPVVGVNWYEVLKEYFWQEEILVGCFNNIVYLENVEEGRRIRFEPRFLIGGSDEFALGRRTSGFKTSLKDDPNDSDKCLGTGVLPST